jgi:ABC-2 type transport system ATP-binding protein
VERPLDELLIGRATPAYRVRLRSDGEQESERVGALLRAEPWVTAVEIEVGGELSVSVESVDSAELHLSAALAKAETRIVSVQPEEATLERAFLELTQ